MQDLKTTLLTDPDSFRSNADRWALFIDIDGTLLEMAPTPDAVIVPPNLIGMLGALSQSLGGALALSTGRSVAEADRILAPLTLITSGVHGTEVRAAAAGETTMLVQPSSAGLLKEILDVASVSPDIVVEKKGAGIAVHYRKAPELRPYLEEALGKIASRRETIILRPGRRVLEVLPKGYSKGTGLASLMRIAPFKGRLPIMIGDDYGDESALAMATELGGLGLRVAGEYFPPERADFTGVIATRTWLARIAGVHAYNDDTPVLQPADG
jgi:trehalose 6-phosphate phosphatase